MKILIIDNAAISHKDGRYFVYKTTGEFGRELMNFGHEVEYFQLSRSSISSISDYDLFLNGLRVSSAKVYPSKILTYFLAYFLGVQRIVKSDFVYIYYPNSFSFLGVFAWLIGKKYGLYIRGEKGIHSKKSKWLYKNASVIFTVSHAFTDAVNFQFAIPKAHTVKPMIGFSDRDIVSDRDYSKTDGFNILFLGRLDRQKGLFELFEAMAALKIRSEFTFYLDIVGGGTYLKELETTAGRLGISDIVNFRGPLTDLDDIRNAYLSSDIYILPTYHEGFPRTLYEAMIFGTPIITTFVGGISALMENEVNCYEIQPKSAKSIEEKLLFVMSNYSASKKIADNGILTVRNLVDFNRYSHATHLNQILKG